MMFSVPLLSTFTYFELSNSFTLGIILLEIIPKTDPAFRALTDSYLEAHKNIRTPIVEFAAYDYKWVKPDYNILKL
jgi:hypothetical protein